jgi:hypothetical protein
MFFGLKHCFFPPNIEKARKIMKKAAGASKSRRAPVSALVTSPDAALESPRR